MEDSEERVLKSDSAEYEKRVNPVYLMLLQGFTRKQILQYCAETWGVKERSTDYYLQYAREIF